MKKVITGIGILVLLGILGGGWFFSGVTYEAGLNPEFENTSEVGVAEDRVTIENITQGTISLNVEEEMWGVMLEDGIYGVLGANGSAVVNKIISLEGDIITREILVSGIREFFGSKNNIFDVLVLSKYKTAFQMLAIIVLLLSIQDIMYKEYFYYLGIFLLWISALISIYTAIVYFKKSLTILRD